MAYKTFLLALVAFVLPLSVSSTVISTANIHNCSGEAPPAPTTYTSYFSSFGPQVTAGHGWEEWTLIIPDDNNQSMFHFRWTRGDPAALISIPQRATFSAFYEKTGFKANLKGSLKSSIVGDTFLSISIGNNYLTFDGTEGPFGLWNTSVDIEGLRVNAIVESMTPSVPFDPAVNGEKGLLVPDYHVSQPIARGHANANVTLPSGLSWSIRTISTLKHAYAYKPIQNLLSTYTRVSTFFEYNSLNWFTAKAKSGEDTTAAQYVYGAPDLSEITLKYQSTNEPSIFNITSISSDSHDYSVTFAGCQNTMDTPYVFNSTSLVQMGTAVDSAGGKTEYWNLQTNALFIIDGKPWTNSATIGSLGVLELYTSP